MNSYDEIQYLLKKTNSGEAPTAEKNLERLERILEGSDVDIDIFITSNLRLVVSALFSFLQRHPKAKYLLLDLFSAGLLKITTATHSLVARGRENKEWFRESLGLIDEDGYLLAVRYLYVSIYRRIQTTYEKDSYLPISSQLRERSRPPGAESPLKRIYVEDSVFEMIPSDPLREVSFMMDILDVCQNKHERTIIQESVTKSERCIASEIGYSRRYIKERKDQVYSRFCVDYNWGPNDKSNPCRPR